MTVDIEALRKLCEAATREMYADDEPRGGYNMNAGWFSVHGWDNREIAMCSRKEDAAFLDTARTALPALLDEVERLRNERDARDKLARECQNQAELRGKDAARWAEERDRLRALLAEACEIARRHTDRERMRPAPPKTLAADEERLAVIAREGGLP